MSTAPDLMQDEAQRLAQLSGESEAQAVVVSLKERLERLEGRRQRRDAFESLRRQWQSTPRIDESLTAESLCDEHGLPT